MRQHRVWSPDALSPLLQATGQQLLSPFVGTRFAEPPHAQLRVFKPYYDQLFGESASYRAYMAKIAEELP